MNSDSPHPEPAGEGPLLDEQMVAYLDGELDDETARQIETLVADDPKLGERLAQLGQAWDMLDHLERSGTEGTFTQDTLELVAVQAEAEAGQHGARLPKLRRRRRAMIAGSLLAAAVAGFLAVAALRGDPNHALLEDLPVLENLDQYRLILNDNDSIQQSIDFLRKLRQQELFVEEDEQGSEGGKHEPR